MEKCEDCRHPLQCATLERCVWETEKPDVHSKSERVASKGEKQGPHPSRGRWTTRKATETGMAELPDGR